VTTRQDIICISSIDWDFIWQGHQEIMSRLAAAGNRVLFVENTGVRAPQVKDIGRLRSRIRNWRRGTKGFREERQNLFVFSPVVLPLPYSRLARWMNRTILLRALRRWMRAAHFHNPIVWTFLPTPLARDLIRGLDPRLTIYYCIDDLASSSHAARKITHTEERVFSESDLVFVTSEKLYTRASRFSTRVHVFPFGVSYENFERVRLAPDEVPADIRGLPRPVIGYVGGLHRWVDQGLVAAVADAMPESSLVLVGPPQADVSTLKSRRNVHLLGARAHPDVPRYIKGFDVGIVPYHLSEYTSHVYPTKLNEYLAMGLPVVATDLLEIQRFNANHGDIVRIAGQPEGFVTAVREAAGDTGEEARGRRLRVAQENSWSARIAAMSALIEDRIVERERAAEHWNVTLGRLYRNARRRTLQTLAGALALYLVLFCTPLVWGIARPLRVASDLRPADAIVVLGGGVGESGERGGGYEERVKRAVDLYRTGLAKHIVFSSGYVHVFRETEVMRALAISQGVNPSDIVLEARAASTREYVLFVTALLNQHHWRRILLVSSPYHMRRAILTWHKLEPAVTVLAAAPPETRFYKHTFGASLEQIQGIAHEYAALAYYWMNGWI
jgi:uncharacterized SAM-binding protein YcdF (DUF218 family)/glycosyltransferase involved in cell wall biosynthesis